MSITIGPSWYLFPEFSRQKVQLNMREHNKIHHKQKQHWLKKQTHKNEGSMWTYSSIQGLNGIVNFLCWIICYETKAPRSSALTVINYFCLHNISMFPKQVLQCKIINTPSKVTHMNTVGVIKSWSISGTSERGIIPFRWRGSIIYPQWSAIKFLWGINQKLSTRSKSNINPLIENER